MGPGRKIAGMACALILGLAVAAGRPAASPTVSQDAREIKLVIAITQFPSTLHPNIDSMLAKSYVLGMTMRPFTAYDPEWELVCMLCTALPSIENGRAEIFDRPAGGQGIRLTYTIDPEARWGDGAPVTTEDVLFTVEVGKNPLSGISNGEIYRRILDVEVEDDKTFTLVMDRVTYNYQALGGLRLVPSHLERPRFSEPKDYKRRTLYQSDPTNPGLYFGPYRVEAFEPGSHITMTPNPTWYGAAPHFDQIIVRTIGNTAALEANILSGSIDMVAGELGLKVDQAAAFGDRHGDEFAISFKQGLFYEHIDLNLDNPLLRDVRVRRALLHAIDREAISRHLFDGAQPVAHSFVNPLDWVYHKAIRTYPYDPEKARALLDQAGFSDLRDGVRRDAAGRDLTFELMTTAGDRTRELVQQVLQAQWRAVGVETRIRNQPARVLFGKTITERLYTGMAMYAWLSAPESVPLTTLHSSQIPSHGNNFSGQNYPGWRNEEADALIDSIERELDRDKRRAMWGRLQNLYAEELPVLPLYYRADVFIVPPWLTGVRPTGHLDTSSLEVERWRVSPGHQAR